MSDFNNLIGSLPTEDMLWSLINGKSEISCIVKDMTFELRPRPRRTPEVIANPRVMSAISQLVIYRGHLEWGRWGLCLSSFA
jgi:hypothetical protein